MPAADLEKLEQELGNSISTEGVNINVSKGTRLYRDIRKLLKKRHRISEIKGLVLL